MADQSHYVAYCNGQWAPLHEVRIDLADRGFLLGDTVFDLSRTFGGRGFKLEEHIDRLYRSLAYVRIDPGVSAEAMLEITEEAIQRNEHLRADVGDFNVGQYVTRGHGLRAWMAESPTLIVKVGAIPFEFYARAYEEGMHAAITRTRSYSPAALDPKIKHHSRLNMTLAELEANDIEPGAWPILTDADGNITEGSGYNVFIVTNSVIKTPRDDALLQGISRGTVFELANTLEIPVIEEDLQPYDVISANEVFFSSTNCCLIPVSHVNRHRIGTDDRAVGPVTQRILDAWSDLVGLDIVDQMMQFSRLAAIPFN